MSQQGNSATGSPVVRVLTFVGMSLLLVIALVAMDIFLLNRNNPASARSPHYYMALGNSLSFGYQPNLDFSAGFADDILTYLRSTDKIDSVNIVNYACAGETTTTMIQGGCVARFAHHGSYIGAQLQAAVSFLERHRGEVSPVTLEIGANDVLKDWDANTCSPTSSLDADIALMDNNLTSVILPQLVNALVTPRGARAGDLHLLNYYNPFARQCPNSAQFVNMINSHLSDDAAVYRVQVVDVYNLAFGGDLKTASNVCSYTWYCSPYHDIHPNNDGYAAIAKAVEGVLGLPGTLPVPHIVLPVGFAAPLIAALWRRPVLAEHMG